jgi:putative hydrolase of the HAD superfamily
VPKSENGSGGDGRRYDAVFLDVDGTLLWVDLDVEGYVEDLAGYAREEKLTVEGARGPLWKGMRQHIRENINYPSEEELAKFRRKNARRTADSLGISAPTDLLVEVADRRIWFNPYPESEAVLEELRGLGIPLYVVSNWDVALPEVLGSLGWLDYFDGVVISAVVGSEKPDGGIFREALKVAGVRPDRAVHVGNDPEADVRGAAGAGIDAVLVARKPGVEAPEAVATMPDLRGLPALLRG